jgi:hypothetical protein
MNNNKENKLDSGHIYLLQLDEHKNKNIYKIGKTSHVKIKDRIKQYPKNTNLIFSCNCIRISQLEKEIIDTFKIKFTKYSIGNEYFVGDVDDMLIELNLIINKYHETFNEVKNNSFFANLSNEFDNTNGGFTLDSDELIKLLDKTDIAMNVKEELYEFNIFQEYNKLIKNKETIKNYDKAILNICECLIEKVEHDKEYGDYVSELNNNKLKQAGELLFNYDGTSVMLDTLQLWIPKRYRKEISILWNGIGDWCE